MTKSRKLRIIREAMYEEFPDMDYLEREKLVRAWLAFPLSVLKDSLAAGYATVDENPYTDPNFNPEWPEPGP